MAPYEQMPTATLNNGVAMPLIGLGLGNGLSSDEIVPIVRTALEIGYRSFDTATKYRNERGLGIALEQSGVPREEVFVTTKVWHDAHGHDATIRAFDASLAELGLDYVDLYLIHFPAPQLGLYVETWRALETLYECGRARAIGVANFEHHHVIDLLGAGSVVPAVNQIELQPRFQRRALRALHDEHGIRTVAWGPLARGLALREPAFTRLAERYGATPAQIVLRWHMQLGNIVIPRSTSPARLQENLAAAAVPPLDAAAMEEIEVLDSDGRTGPDPNGDVDSVDMRIAAVEERWNEILRKSEGSALAE